MSSVTRMIIDDPSKFSLLTADLKKCVAEAATNSVNKIAYNAMIEARKNVRSSFITRNTFTVKQILYTKMPQGNHELSEIKSVVGVTTKASYMVRQEQGGEHTPTHGSTLAIPTDEARGGSKAKPVKPKFYVNKIKKRYRIHGQPRRYKRKGKNQEAPKTHKAKQYKSHAAFLVARAAVAHKKNLLLPWGGSGNQRNLHWVSKFQSGGSEPFETVQIYKFSQYKTFTRAREWLKPACEKVSNGAQKIFASQLKKAGL